LLWEQFSFKELLCPYLNPTVLMNLTPIDPSQATNLYEQVANRIRGLIEEGTLQPGDRLPSVRQLRQQLSVSMSTVLEAYRLLEDDGLIQARPQSGYFVRETPLTVPAEPNQSHPSSQISPINPSLFCRVMYSALQPDVTNFGTAIPAMELMPLNSLNRLMGQALRHQSIDAHSYGDPSGCESLRREIARRMMAAGCSITPEQVVITNGATEAIYLALQAIAQPGDIIAIESPTYYALLEILQALRLRALELPTYPRDGICLDALEAALAQHQVAAVLLVSNFSNPLGSCMGDVKKKQLVDLLNQYQTPLIEDDIYGELSFDHHRPKAIKAFDTEGRVVYCCSFSKTLSPGLRVGWVVGGVHQAQIAQTKLILNQMTAIAPQLAVSAFLANGGYDRHLRQLRRAYQSHQLKMRQAIHEYFPAETRLTRPNGGHVLWLELPSHFDAMQLYQEALEHQINIAPGVMFSPSGGFGHCLRLNYGIPWNEQIDYAMLTLGKLAKGQLASPSRR
jgi:DNA-binding transcriptional MocR family regulator